MKRVNYRICMERPDVGFPFYSPWQRDDLRSALQSAMSQWNTDPQAVIQLQYSNGSGVRARTLPLTIVGCQMLLQTPPEDLAQLMHEHRRQLHADQNYNRELLL